MLIAGREHIFGIRKLFYFLFLENKKRRAHATQRFSLTSYFFRTNTSYHYFWDLQTFYVSFFKTKDVTLWNATFFTEIYVFRTIAGNVGQQNLSHASLTLRVAADRLRLFNINTSYHCFFRFANFLRFFFTNKKTSRPVQRNVFHWDMPSVAFRGNVSKPYIIIRRNCQSVSPMSLLGGTVSQLKLL